MHITTKCAYAVLVLAVLAWGFLAGTALGVNELGGGLVMTGFVTLMYAGMVFQMRDEARRAKWTREWLNDRI